MRERVGWVKTKHPKWRGMNSISATPRDDNKGRGRVSRSRPIFSIYRSIPRTWEELSRLFFCLCYQESVEEKILPFLDIKSRQGGGGLDRKSVSKTLLSPISRPPKKTEKLKWIVSFFSSPTKIGERSFSRDWKGKSKQERVRYGAPNYWEYLSTSV